MTYSILIIFAISLLTTCLLWWRIYKAQEVIDQLLSSKKTLQVNLPIIGVQGSGKTVFLSTLTHQMIGERPDHLKQQISANFLERERERLLDHDHSQNRNTSSEEVIYQVLKDFKAGRLEGSREPEDIFFSAIFGIENETKQATICHFIDIPGGQFEAEEYHGRNIFTRIKDAQGLIYIVDSTQMTHLLSREEDPQNTEISHPHTETVHSAEVLEESQDRSVSQRIKDSESLHRRTLNYMIENKSHQNFPIWVVLTKADLIPEFTQPNLSKPLIERRVTHFKERVMRRLFDGLHVSGVEIPHLCSLTSAVESSQEYWRSISLDSMTFFKHIRDQILTRYQDAKHKQKQLRSRRLIALLVSICALALIVPTWEGLQALSLPNLQIQRTWDINSLDQKAKQYLAFESKLLLFHRAELEENLKTLSERYHQVLTTQLHEFLRDLPNRSLYEWTELEKSGGSPMKKIDRVIEHIRSFYSQIQHSKIENPSVVALHEAEELTKHLRVWMTSIHTNKPTTHSSIELLLSLLEEGLILNQAQDWLTICERLKETHLNRSTPQRTKTLKSSLTKTTSTITQYREVSCALGEYGKQEQTRLFLEALRGITDQSLNETYPPAQIFQKTLPSLHIQRVLQKALPNPPIRHELMNLTQESWRQGWSTYVAAYLEIKPLLKRFAHLKNFTEQRQVIAQELTLSVEQLQIPNEIQVAWTTFLAELVQEAQKKLKKKLKKTKKTKKAKNLKSPELQSLIDFITWAKPYLSVSQRMKLEFEEEEKRWKVTLKETFASQDSDRLLEVLKQMSDRLDHFKTKVESGVIREWHTRIRHLKRLRKPRTYTVKVHDLTCKVEKLRSFGIDWKDQLRMDKLKPYLKIKSEGKLIEMNDYGYYKILWRAWGELEFHIFDRDIGADDHLFLSPITPALGLFQTQKRSLKSGTCFIKTEVSPMPSIIEWLQEEHLF